MPALGGVASTSDEEGEEGEEGEAERCGKMCQRPTASEWHSQDEKSGCSDSGDHIHEHWKGRSLEKWGGVLYGPPWAPGGLPEPREETSANALHSGPHTVSS